MGGRIDRSHISRTSARPTWRTVLDRETEVNEYPEPDTTTSRVDCVLPIMAVISAKSISARMSYLRSVLVIYGRLGQFFTGQTRKSTRNVFLARSPRLISERMGWHRALYTALVSVCTQHLQRETFNVCAE